MKTRKTLLYSIIGLFVCSILALPTFASEAIRLHVAQDSNIKSASPDTNFDTDALVLTQEQKAYIQFDASHFEGDVLDINNFEFAFTADYGRDCHAYLITGDGVDDWNEATITWNNAPGNDTASGNAFLNNAEFTSTLLGYTENLGGGNITVGFLWDSQAAKDALINELNTGDRKATIGLGRDSSSRYARYACKENIAGYNAINDGLHAIRVDATVESVDGIMLSQPESREVFYYGEVMNTSGTDINESRITLTATGDGLYDGNLLLAFRLPELPAGKVISSASLSWYFLDYYDNRVGPQHHLYGLPYRDGSTDPGITANDWYVGNDDDTDAVLIKENTLDTDNEKEWVRTSNDRKSLAAFLQEQYQQGAQAGDWVILRFSPDDYSTAYVRHTIVGPNASDPQYKPFVSYSLSDQSEGYWKVLNNQGPVTVDPNGVTGDNEGYLGASGNVSRAMLFPFEFPQMDAGEYAEEVTFTADLSNPYSFPGRYFEIDLYGLDYRGSTDFQSSDYWIGPYSLLPEEGLNGTPIASSITEDYIYSQPASWSLDADGSLRAACYINAQRDAGATSSDYGFFRMNPRYDALYYTRQMINNPEIAIKVSTTVPSCPAEAPATEYACPMIGYTDYPDGDIDGDCMVTLADLRLTLSDWLDCFAEPASYYCP